MPERLRDIASRLRAFLGSRRHAPRRHARLRASVSLLDAKPRANSAALEGHTRDVSANGLAVILPAIRIGERYLTGDSHLLRITLRLPDASIQIQGVPVRYEHLDEEGAEETGYLIGVRIKEMSDQDRALFDDYLKKMAKG